MKYYAVTEDPRELFHYGVKGMKWGQHLFGDDLKPKSAAYKKARSKLRASKMRDTKKVKAPKPLKTETQNNINKISRQDRKYLKAVEKAQRRASAIESLHRFDVENDYRKQLARDQKAAVVQRKLQNVKADNDLKALQKSIKTEKHMDKVLQEAREGRLRYGKLSEEQIGRVQDRLNLEESARRLGGKEKPSWRQQKKEARRAGKLEGIKRGTAAAMEEVARAGTKYGIHMINQLKLRSQAVGEGRNQRAKNRVTNRKTHADMRREMRDETYKELIRDPNSDYYKTHKFNGPTYRNAVKLQKLNDQKEQKRLEASARQLNDDLYKKWLLGGKQDTTEAIEKRLAQRDDVHDMIYGRSSKKLDSSKKGKKTNRVAANSLFENVSDADVYIVPGKKFDQVKDTGYEKLDAITKSINRYKKKVNRRKKPKADYDVVID